MNVPDGFDDVTEQIKVPDGFDDVAHSEDLRERARKLVNQGQADYLPTMATAAGQGVKEIAQKIMRLSGKMAPQSFTDKYVPDSVKEFASDDAIKATEAREAELAKQGGGAFGGEVGRAIPAAIPAGAVEGAIGKLGLDASPSIFTRFLGRMGQRAAGGATAGAVSADPGKEFDDALLGAGVGAGFGGAEKVGKRIFTGTVHPSEDLLNLRGDVARANGLPGAAQRELFVPISQGADDSDPVSSIAKSVYKTALPYVPGVEKQLTGQAARANDTVREIMLQTGAPELTSGGVSQRTLIQPGGGPSVQRDAFDLKKQYDSMYGNLRSVNNIAVPKDFSSDLFTRIRTADPSIPKSDIQSYVDTLQAHLEHLAENNNGKSVNGWNLKNLRDYAQEMNSNLPMAQREAMTGETKDHIDDIFARRWNTAFRSGNQADMDVLGDYVKNRPNYENFRPLKEAVDAAAEKKGSFRFGSVAGRARDFTDIQGIDQNAAAVLNQPAAQISQAGRLIGYGVTGAPLGLGSAGTTAAILAGGNAMATKTGQKMLYGDTATQRAIADLLRSKYGSAIAQTLGLGGRTAIEQQEFD